MANELDGRRVAILAADGVERVELEQPRDAVQNAGAQTQLLSIAEGEIQARDHDLYDAGTWRARAAARQAWRGRAVSGRRRGNR